MFMVDIVEYQLLSTGTKNWLVTNFSFQLQDWIDPHPSNEKSITHVFFRILSYNLLLTFLTNLDPHCIDKHVYIIMYAVGM